MLVCGVQLVMVALDVTGVPRTVIGILFIGVVPGYALLSAISGPWLARLDAIVRLALAIPISLALTTVGGLALNRVGWTVPPDRNVLWLSGLTISLALVGLVRRSRAEPNRDALAVIAFATSAVIVVALTTTSIGIVGTGPQFSIYVTDSNQQVASFTTRAGRPVLMNVTVACHFNCDTPIVLIHPDGREQTLDLGSSQQVREEASFVFGEPGMFKVEWSLRPTSQGIEAPTVYVWVHVE